MSTRSVTIVRQRSYYGPSQYKVEELFRFYRHCDGYPEGHGLQMAKAFMDAEYLGTMNGERWISDGLNNRNWAQKCFAQLFACDCDLELETANSEHGDIDYLYVVEGDYERYGGKHNIDLLPVTIAVHSVVYDHWDADYKATLESEPLFRGTPREFYDWASER